MIFTSVSATLYVFTSMFVYLFFFSSFSEFTHDTNFCLKKLIECSLIRDANFTEIKLTENTEENFFF